MGAPSLLIAIGVLMLGCSGSAASSPLRKLLAPDLPPGTWASDCTAVTWDGATLTAFCKDVGAANDATYFRSSLDVRTCAWAVESVSNAGGYLVCDPAPPPPPPPPPPALPLGNWTTLCKVVNWDGITLYATCYNDLPAYEHYDVSNALNIHACAPSATPPFYLSSLYVYQGRIKCESKFLPPPPPPTPAPPLAKPPGSWEGSCTVTFWDGFQLEADCGDGFGGQKHTHLFISRCANGAAAGLSNERGVLTCAVAAPPSPPAPPPLPPVLAGTLPALPTGHWRTSCLVIGGGWDGVMLHASCSTGEGDKRQGNRFDMRTCIQGTGLVNYEGFLHCLVHAPPSPSPPQRPPSPSPPPRSPSPPTFPLGEVSPPSPPPSPAPPLPPLAAGVLPPRPTGTWARNCEERGWDGVTLKAWCFNDYTLSLDVTTCAAGSPVNTAGSQRYQDPAGPVRLACLLNAPPLPPLPPFPPPSPPNPPTPPGQLPAQPKGTWKGSCTVSFWDGVVLRAGCLFQNRNNKTTVYNTFLVSVCAPGSLLNNVDGLLKCTLPA